MAKNSNFNESHSPGRISVIIPTYNYGHFLTACIENLFQQNTKDLEIIVIDDGSTDDTQQIIKTYQSKIKCIYQENAGLSAARNTGLKHATGEFIQFLDADDLLGYKCIEKKKNYLLKNPKISVAVCENKYFYMTNRKGKPITKGQWHLKNNHFDTHFCYFNIAPPHAFLFRRQVIGDVGQFDEALKACEDYDFCLNAIVKGHNFGFCPTGLVYYRRHQNSMSANLSNQHYHDALMHIRLYNYLFIEKTYPVADITANYFAFSAGVMRTISRLNACHQQLKAKLIHILVDSFNKIDTLLTQSDSCADSSIAQLYLLKCLREEPLLHQIIANNSALLHASEVLTKAKHTALQPTKMARSLLDNSIALKDKTILIYSYRKLFN